MRLNIRGRARPAGESGSITRNIARESLIEIRTHGRNTVNQDPALRAEKITGAELLIQGADRVPTGKTFPAGVRLLVSNPQRLTEGGETYPAEVLGGVEVRPCSNPVDRMPLRVWIEVEETPE